MSAGQSTVSATIPAYAGGSVVASFEPQGGGEPAILSTSSTIDAAGHFSLLAWDNSNALYAPSTTVFLISVGMNTYYATKVSIAGTSQDISSAFSAAPVPSGSIGGVAITGTPTLDQKPTATSANTATWQ